MSGKPYLAAPGTIALYVLWASAMGVLLVVDRATALQASEIGAVVAAIVALGRWTLPTGTDDPANDLRQSGPRLQLALRGVVIIGAFVWFAAIGRSLTGGFPAVGAVVRWAYSVPTGLPGGAFSLLVLGTVALLPALILFALATHRRELGLEWHSGGYVRLALWLALPIAAWIWRAWSGHIGTVALIFVSTDWAMLGMSALFSLLHYGITVPEEHGRVVAVVANAIAENVPIAWLFGLIALRSRSIAMGTVVHAAFDATRALYRS